MRSERLTACGADTPACVVQEPVWLCMGVRSAATWLCLTDSIASCNASMTGARVLQLGLEACGVLQPVAVDLYSLELG